MKSSFHKVCGGPGYPTKPNVFHVVPAPKPERDLVLELKLILCAYQTRRENNGPGRFEMALSE